MAARLDALATELDGIVSSSQGTNGDDEHDPEGATVAFERARTAALLAQARADLEALERAEVRLADGDYRRCEVCLGPIGADRLAALPATATCVGCAGRGPGLDIRGRPAGTGGT